MIYVEDGSDPWNDSEKITTYAAALLKVDDSSPAKPLAGAKFKFYGLKVEKTADGVYTVTSYDPTAYNTAEGATQNPEKLGDEMEVDADGQLYIIGLKENATLKGIETEAPAGYNLLEKPFKITIGWTAPDKISDPCVWTVSDTEAAQGYAASLESGARIQDGLIQIQVENQSGTQLPETGGIGTTLFYIVGGLLMTTAAVLMITKKSLSL